MMSSLQADRHRAGKLAVVTKGAPDVLLGRCSHELVDGVVEPLDETRRARVLADVERLSGQAYRTLAVAYLPLEVTAPRSSTSRWRRTSSTPAWSASSTHRVPRPLAPSPRLVVRGSAS